MSAYDEKYLNTKVREYDGVIKINFLGNDCMFLSCPIRVSE